MPLGMLSSNVTRPQRWGAKGQLLFNVVARVCARFGDQWYLHPRAFRHACARDAGDWYITNQWQGDLAWEAWYCLTWPFA